MVRVVLRHLTGSRADQADVLDLDEQAEVVMGAGGAALARLDTSVEEPIGRWQARIIPVEGSERRFVLVDLGSDAGIFVNHRRVADAILLHSGDILQLGAEGPEIEFRVEGTLL